MLAPTTPLRPSRYRSLDAWRGLACLMVVFFHSTLYLNLTEEATWQDPAAWLVYLMSFGWAGVPIFFVISGYCISATADNTRLKSQSVGKYFARRLRRIFPPYLILLAITVPIVIVAEWWRPGFFEDSTNNVLHPASLDAWQWFGTATLTEVWRDNVVGSEKLFFLGHAWTLGYEEQFYAVTGVILLLASRRFFFAAGLVTAAVLALKVALPLLNRLFGIYVDPDRIGGFFFDGYWVLFAEGILAYYAIVYGSRKEQVLLAMPLLALAVYAGLHFEGMTLHLFAASVFALAILFLHPFDHAIAASPWMAPLMACGKRCYSIYLVHLPITRAISHAMYLLGLQSATATVLITVPLCLAGSIAGGWLFFYLVERHFLNSSPPVARHAEPLHEPRLHRRAAAPAVVVERV